MEPPQIDHLLGELHDLVKTALDSTYRVRSILKQISREHERRTAFLTQASDDATTARAAGEAALAALSAYARTSALRDGGAR